MSAPACRTNVSSESFRKLHEVKTYKMDGKRAWRLLPIWGIKVDVKEGAL